MGKVVKDDSYTTNLFIDYIGPNRKRVAMSIKIPSNIVDAFLSDVMEIEEQPRFMHGAHDTARRDKLLKLLEEYSEKI